MAVAPLQPSRMSWTRTSLAELDIDELLETWGGIQGQVDAMNNDYEEEAMHIDPRAQVTTTADLALPGTLPPRISSLVQLPTESFSPEEADRVDSQALSSTASSPVESPDPGFDLFQFRPIPSGLVLSDPQTPEYKEQMTTSPSGDLVSLDEIFGTSAGRASPFPTLSSASHLSATSSHGPRPSTLLKNVRALAERFEANLPSAPVLVTSHQHNQSRLPTPRRPSVAPSSASVASGSTGSGSLTGSGSSTSTARAENRPLAMYPRPPPAPRGQQQYPKPPPPPRSKEKDKAKKGSKGSFDAESVAGVEQQREGSTAPAAGARAKGWGNFALR